MASWLKNIVRFTAVPAGGSSTQAHNLNVNGVAVIPDSAQLSNGNFSRGATTATNITVTNNGLSAADCDVLVEHWHTFERSLTGTGPTGDNGINLTPQPFTPGAGGGASGSGFVPMGGPLLSGTTTRSGTGLYVNPIASNAADDSDVGTPFLTISGALAAITAVGTPTDLTTALRRWSVFVAPGNYDEDLTIPVTIPHVDLVALGGVTLGDGIVNVNGGSTTPRNVTWEVDATYLFGTQPRLGFYVVQTPGVGTYEDWDTGSEPGEVSSMEGWRISGDVHCVDGLAADYTHYANLIMQNVVLRSITNATITSATFTTMFFTNVRVEKTFTMGDTVGARADGILAYASNCDFGFNRGGGSSASVAFLCGDMYAVNDCQWHGDITVVYTNHKMVQCGFQGSTNTINLKNVYNIDYATMQALAFTIQAAGSTVTLGTGNIMNASTETFVFGNTNIGTAAGDSFLTPGFENGTAGTSNTKQIVIMNSGSSPGYFVLGISVFLNIAAGSGANTITYEVLAGGTPMSPTVKVDVANGGTNSGALFTSSFAASTKTLSVRATKPGGGITAGSCNPVVAVHVLKIWS